MITNGTYIPDDVVTGHEKLVVVVRRRLGLEHAAHLKKKSNDLSLSLTSAPGDVFPYVDFEHPAFILCQLFVGSPPAVYKICVRVRCRYLSIYALSVYNSHHDTSCSSFLASTRRLSVCIIYLHCPEIINRVITLIVAIKGAPCVRFVRRKVMREY